MNTAIETHAADCLAHRLTQVIDRGDYVAMLATMACGRPYCPEARYHHARATLADGSVVAVQDGQFVFESQGEPFATRPAPENAVLPPFAGPISEWELPIEISFNVAPDDRPFPENVLTAAVREAMPGIQRAHVAISGVMTLEDLRAAFPSQDPEGVMGISMQHYEGPSVLRPREAYNHVENLTTFINQHTTAQRRPRRRADISVGGYAGLLSICNEITDLDWRLQSELIDANFVCRRAAEIHALTELDTPPA